MNRIREYYEIIESQWPIIITTITQHLYNYISNHYIALTITIITAIEKSKQYRNYNTLPNWIKTKVTAKTYSIVVNYIYYMGFWTILNVTNIAIYFYEHFISPIPREYKILWSLKRNVEKADYLWGGIIDAIKGRIDNFIGIIWSILGMDIPTTQATTHLQVETYSGVSLFGGYIITQIIKIIKNGIVQGCKVHKKKQKENGQIENHNSYISMAKKRINDKSYFKSNYLAKGVLILTQIVPTECKQNTIEQKFDFSILPPIIAGIIIYHLAKPAKYILMNRIREYYEIIESQWFNSCYNRLICRSVYSSK